MSAAQRVVVEADGGSRGNPGPAGYGAVVFTADRSEVLAERREALHGALERLCDGEEAESPAREAVRRSLVEVLRDGDRPGLTARLDRALLGLESPERLRAAS